MAGYDALYGNIETIGKLGGNPQLAKFPLDGLITMVTQGKGLLGSTKRSRWWPVGLGLWRGTNADQLSGYAFVR